MFKRIVLLLLILSIPAGVIAKNITLVSIPPGETKTFWINDSNISSLPNNITITLIKKIDVEGENKTVIVYDADMVRAYQALVAEQRVNISKLQKEIKNKDKLLAEYIGYKKKNIELQKNISTLNSEISMLKAENDVLSHDNEQYKDLVTNLIEKSSNGTKNSVGEIYDKNKKLIGGFTWSFTIGLVSVCVIAYGLMRLKQKYEDL